MIVPKFFLATNEEKSEWKKHPLTAAFIDYMAWEEARVADEVLTCVAEDHIPQAKRMSAVLQAIQTIQESIDRRAADRAETMDTTFTDPAAIWGEEK